MSANFTKQSVKRTGKERKEKLVAELTEKMDASGGLVFTDYKGITHQQLENLRRELKKADSSILIAKNSLLNISLGKSKDYSDFKDNESLEGPSAMLIVGDDSVEPLKMLKKSIKDAGLPKVKFGILEGQLLDEAGVIKLASLPSREVLLTQFVGMLNSPIQGFVTGLNSIPQKFVMTLDAIAKSKPADAPATDPTPKAEEKPTESPEETKEASDSSEDNKPEESKKDNAENANENQEEESKGGEDK